jgi:hypothetical protein
MIRLCYRGLLWLHPPVFRRQFAGEMLWIFDQAAASQGTFALFFDGVGSLARQWLLRSGWWKIALALSLALVEIVFGGFGMMAFRQRHLVPPAGDPMIGGAIAHQPLTIGLLMYLAVFLTAGLTMMIIGLNYWLKTCLRRGR